MSPAPLLGVFLHAVGGYAASSFYIPFRGVRKWAWESYWLVGGLFSWLVVPGIVACLTCPEFVRVLHDAPTHSLMSCYVFGLLWGIGGLTFGLSMRYLGMSLGYALSLGFCAVFGTVIPPLFTGQLAGMASQLSGRVVFAGVATCLLGIAMCGRAGVLKEREQSVDEKRALISEFSFAKGIWVAIFAGVMSACMAFGIAAGKPIATLAVERGTASIWQNTPVFVVILAGGFTTNFLWCLALNIRNRTATDYVRGPGRLLIRNYLLSSIAGTTWYMQFMFYGMGTTKMGRYDFSSWTIHMSFIIVFSNIWGLAFHEWAGASRRARAAVFTGIAILIASTIIVGFGNYIAAPR